MASLRAAKPKPGVNPVWLVLAFLIGGVVYYTFATDTIPYFGSQIRPWTIRLLGAAVVSFCLGMCFRNTAAKIMFFTFLAVFAALGVGEAYLAHLDTATRQGEVRQPGAIAREFAAEVEFDRGSLELYIAAAASPGISANVSPASQDNGEPAQLVFDKEKIAKVFKEHGINVPPGFLSPNEEYTLDQILGYKPVAKASKICALNMKGKRILYSAVYTTLPTGWRVTPQNSGATEAVVFMGCSFTFGEGVNDRDTFPYMVGEKLGSRYQVFNFGFHGYGSHQMLAMVEKGFLDDIAKKYSKIHLFYLTILEHELRSAGKSSWDQDGPYYELVDGKVQYKGTFRNNKDAVGALRITDFGQRQKMLNLHIAIMEEANRIAKEKYNTPLNIITWHNVDYTGGMQNNGVPNLRLPNFVGEGYYIQDDGHPTGKANSIISDMLVAYIKSGKW